VSWVEKFVAVGKPQQTAEQQQQQDGRPLQQMSSLIEQVSPCLLSSMKDTRHIACTNALTT
jgi:hypothetical protein